MIATYRGKNVDELTREEAIVALKECGRQMNHLFDVYQSSNRTWAMFFDCSMGPKKDWK